MGRVTLEGQNDSLYFQKGLQKQEWASWKQKTSSLTSNQMEWLNQKEKDLLEKKKRKEKNNTESHICMKPSKFVVIEDKAGFLTTKTKTKQNQLL